MPMPKIGNRISCPEPSSSVFAPFGAVEGCSGRCLQFRAEIRTGHPQALAPAGDLVRARGRGRPFHRQERDRP